MRQAQLRICGILQILGTLALKSRGRSTSTAHPDELVQRQVFEPYQSAMETVMPIKAGRTVAVL
jgi:hypothetical protein